MTNQEIIDHYMAEFYKVQRMTVPIELESYLHRMLTQARLAEKREAKTTGFFKRCFQ